LLIVSREVDEDDSCDIRDSGDRRARDEEGLERKGGNVGYEPSDDQQGQY